MQNHPEYTEIFPLKSLFDNAWVFCLFGGVLGISGGGMARFGMDTNGISDLMFEPISVGYFGLMNLPALFLIGVCNLHAHKRGKNAIDYWVVRRFLLPIAFNGLSVGTIIAGSMLGLGIGFQMAQVVFGYAGEKTIADCLAISALLFFYTACFGMAYWYMLYREPAQQIGNAWRKLARRSV